MKLLVFGIVIFTFFKPDFGAWLFIIFTALMEIWIVLANKTKIKVKNKDNKYTPKEVEVIERYRLFFQYPFASRIISSMFSGIQLSTFLLVPWLLIKGLYLQAMIIGINYFIAPQFAVTLNPQFFLHDNIDKGKIKDPQLISRYTDDMNAIDSALEKMYLNKK